MVEPPTPIAFGLALVETILCDMIPETTNSAGIFGRVVAVWLFSNTVGKRAMVGFGQNLS